MYPDEDGAIALHGDRGKSGDRGLQEGHASIASGDRFGKHGVQSPQRRVYVSEPDHVFQAQAKSIFLILTFHGGV